MKRLAALVLVLVHNRLLRGALVVMLAGIAAIVLYREVTTTNWNAVGQALLAYRRETLAIAAGAMLLSYAALGAYDVVAVNATVGRRVTHRRAGLIGVFTAAIVNFTGHAYIIGTAIRGRLYGARGVTVPETVAVTAIAGLGFWLGTGLVLALLLIVHPDGVLADLGWPRAADVVVGLAIVAAILAAIALSGRGRTVHLFATRVDLPARRHLVPLLIAGGVDLIGVSLTLYVLMPADVAGSFPTFFATFVAALGLGILSATPGGVGVFEATLLLGLGVSNRPDVVAALAAYRLVYFVVPFVLAICAVLLSIAARHLRGAGTSR